MYRQQTFAFHYIKRIAKELYSLHVRHNCLFTIHFQKELSFNESGDGFLDALCCAFGFTEYQRIISITNKRVATAF